MYQLLNYVLKKVILWIHQRTETGKTRYCFGHLGYINDPLMVSKFHNGIHERLFHILWTPIGSILIITEFLSRNKENHFQLEIIPY